MAGSVRNMPDSTIRTMRSMNGTSPIREDMAEHGKGFVINMYHSIRSVRSVMKEES